jgi:hypothetical protein
MLDSLRAIFCRSLPTHSARQGGVHTYMVCMLINTASCSFTRRRRRKDSCNVQYLIECTLPAFSRYRTAQPQAFSNYITRRLRNRQLPPGKRGKCT